MTRFVQALLYGVEATHPTHFVVPVILLAGAALLASWLPAARAMRIQPREALTAE
jgi:putative ABC transport system permease protein